MTSQRPKSKTSTNKAVKKQKTSDAALPSKRKSNRKAAETPGIERNEPDSGTFSKLAQFAKNPNNKTFQALPVHSRKPSDQTEKESGFFPARDLEDSARKQLVKRQNSNSTKKSVLEKAGGKLLNFEKDLQPQKRESEDKTDGAITGLMSQRKGKTGIQMMTMNAQDMEIEALQKGNRYGMASSDEDDENLPKGKMSEILQELRLTDPQVAQDKRELYKFKRVSEEDWEMVLEGKRKSDEITLVDALGDLADKEQPK